jgi:site-specific recombinase XerD
MTTLSAALASFELAAIADGVTERTVRWYVWLLNESPHAALPWLAGQGIGSVARVTVDLLRQYIGWLRKQPNTRTGAEQSAETIAGYIRALHRFFGWCAIEYNLPDPMARIAFPKTTEQRPKAIDLADFMAMFAATGPGPFGIRNRAILMFLLDTGCRAAGLCALKVADMDFRRKRALVVEKGDRARMVVWTEKTAAYLTAWDEWRSPVPTFFYNTTTQRPLTPNGLRVIIRRLGERAGVQGRVNPHSFRHAFAREYILNGGDLATLSRLLGHRQSQTTTSYYAVFTNDELATMHEQYSPVSRIQIGDGE